MKTIILFFAFATVLFSAASAFGQGYKLTSTAGNFGLIFPSSVEPTAKDETQTCTRPACPLTTHLFVQRDDSLITLAGWVDYNPSFDFDPRAEINANRDNFLKPFKGTVTSEKDIKLGQYSGIEFLASIEGERSVRGRIYIVGKRPYCIVALAPKGTREKDIEKYLDSFKLTR